MYDQQKSMTSANNADHLMVLKPVMRQSEAVSTVQQSQGQKQETTDEKSGSFYENGDESFQLKLDGGSALLGVIGAGNLNLAK